MKKPAQKMSLRFASLRWKECSGPHKVSANGQMQTAPRNGQ